MLKKDLEKKIKEWVESIPSGSDGMTAICEQTGEPFEQIKLIIGPLLKGKYLDASVIFNSWMEHIKPYFDKRSGLIYWRKKPEITMDGDTVSIYARFSKAVA